MSNFCPQLVGSMSQGAAGNPTVAMVEAAFRHLGLHWRYVNMEVPPAGLAYAVRGAQALHHLDVEVAIVRGNGPGPGAEGVHGFHYGARAVRDRRQGAGS